PPSRSGAAVDSSRNGRHARQITKIKMNCIDQFRSKKQTLEAELSNYTSPVDSMPIEKVSSRTACRARRTKGELEGVVRYLAATFCRGGGRAASRQNRR